MHRIQAAVYLLALVLIASCSPSYTRYISNYNFQTTSPVPDYANLYYWAAHPYKKDPSDSLSRALKKDYMPDSTVDVFFIHPTTLTDYKDQRMNADITDAALNAKTDYSSILFQATAFNEQRVFAPRYRQAHLRAYYIDDTVAALQAFDKAYADVKAAFTWYLEHFNNGRPVIIASHSQGSTHAIRLLKEFFDGTKLANRLVVAYIPGMGIPKNAFSTLRLCTDSLQTGCFCGWRTYKRGYNPVFEGNYGESFVTNPLNWQADTSYAPAKLNKGAVLRNFNKVYRGVTDAQVHEGVLWVARPHFPGSFLYRTSNYHIGDINLFYLNIRSNMQTRIRMFWKQ
jgi:predicted GNAT superfamily acetyltransferase